MSERGGATKGAGGPVGVRRRTRGRGPEGPDHLVRSDRWCGLRPGDAVGVAGVSARRSSWEFRAHVHNLRNGEEWVEVVGGRSGERTVRSFSPDRLHPVGPTSPRGARSPAAGGRGASRSGSVPPPFADAPRLPLE